VGQIYIYIYIYIYIEREREREREREGGGGDLTENWFKLTSFSLVQFFLKKN